MVINEMKVVAIIQARMGSTRLPGKVMKLLMNNPVLWHIVQIINNVSIINDIIIATTTLSEDDIIESFGHYYGIHVIRGSVYDVLDRFRIAVIKTKAEIIIRITGDNPCMSVDVIESVLEKHINLKNDYTSNNLIRTFPRGLDIEVINKDILEQIWKTTSDQNDREHVTLYLRKNIKNYKTYNLKAKGQLNRPDLRLSLDTTEDFQLINNIYKHCYDGTPIKLINIIKYLDSNPDLLKINAHIEQKRIDGVIY